MGEKSNDQSIMDKSMRSVFGKYLANQQIVDCLNNKLYLTLLIWLGFFIWFQMFSVGNIPYEATEEKLKEIFSEVGPVISLK